MSDELPRDATERLHIDVAGRTYSIDLPHVANSNSGDPESPPPFWSALWPGARMLAAAIAQESWILGTTALEVGCGLGLPGIVALSLGLRVTFSDREARALGWAAANARLNGFHDFECLLLDWDRPPAEMKVAVLLAADVIYELRDVEPLVGLIKKMLAPGGLCLLANQERLPSKALFDALEESGLPFSARTVRTAEPGQRQAKGTLYRIAAPH